MFVSTKSLTPPIRLDLYGDVLRILQPWSGFPVLSSLMTDFPEIDVFLAGGALRDILSGTERPPKDFDFFIDGSDLDMVLQILGAQGAITFGPFGSPRWFPSKLDTSYADIMHVKHFYNGLSQCNNMLDVLHQFDFTANAIAIDLKTRLFIDPLNGTWDIQRRIMRGVRFDYPDEPISPRHPISRLSVLWFRLLHYSALCEMDIEPITMSWLIKNRVYKRDLAYFTKIFFSPDPRAKLIFDKES